MGTLFSRLTTVDDIEVEEISPSQLYNLHADLTSFHELFDCRCDDQYKTSHIDLAVKVHTPEEVVAKVEQRYCSVCVFYHSSDDHDNKYLVKCKRALAKLAGTTSRTIRMCLITGGFTAFEKKYPFMCTGNANYIEGLLFPSEISDNMYLSNYGVASNPTVLHLMKITHVINCTEDCPFVTDIVTQNDSDIDGSSSSDLLEKVSHIKNMRVPVTDTHSHIIAAFFDKAYDFIESALVATDIEGNCHSQARILVHCKHGASRSASIVAAYLVRKRAISVHDALAYLKARRSKVCPNIGFIEQLEEYAIIQRR